MTTDVRAQFMADKCLYDGLSQAIKLGKQIELNDKQLKPLVLMKQKYKKVFSDNTSKLLTSMPLGKNILELGDSWYGIRFLNEKTNMDIKIEPISEQDINYLKRDGRYERELSKKELDTMLPGLISAEVLEVYKQKMQARGRELLFEHTGVLVDSDGVVSKLIGTPIAEEPEPVDEPTEEIIEDAVDEDYEPVTVSVHAGLRYVQRKLGIKSEVAAEEHRRKNVRDINEAVLDGFGNAEKVWEDDGIAYWFDKDNLMYVVGKQDGYPNIITLYEEEFGFDKSINRTITLAQLDVLAKVREELNKAEVNVSGANNLMEGEIQGINDEIRALESQVELLVAKRAKLMADRELGNKQVKAVKDRYVAESNKLFKKWDA